MIQRTAKFDKVIVNSHRMRARVDILFNGELVKSDINMKSGEINYDRMANVRAHGTCTIADPTLVPDVNQSTILSPFGYELAIYAGIVYAGGAEELLPRGVFPIQEVRFDGRSGDAQVSFADRSQMVSDGRLEQAYVVTAGVDYGEHIAALIRTAFPSADLAFETVGHVPPTTLVIPAESDPWEQATNLARDSGCELFFDVYGRCVLRAENQPINAAPVWTFREGAGGTLKGTALVLTREAVFNRTIVTGSSPDIVAAVPRGVYTDADGQTAYDSAFGHKPRFWSSPFIISDDQAALAAQAIQASDDNAGVKIEFEAVSHYGLEVGDIVQVEHPLIPNPVITQLEAFTLGLTPDQSAVGF